MQSLRDIAPYLALGAAVLGVVLLILVVRLIVGQRRLRRAQLAVLGAHGERDLVAHAQDLEEQVRNLRDAVQGLDGLLTSHKADLDKAFTHRAIVRYDAFRDIGGEQSASIALLDNTGLGPRDQHDPLARLRAHLRQAAAPLGARPGAVARRGRRRRAGAGDLDGQAGRRRRQGRGAGSSAAPPPPPPTAGAGAAAPTTGAARPTGAGDRPPASR